VKITLTDGDPLASLTPEDPSAAKDSKQQLTEFAG
jgi:hypothetical protein